MSVVLTRAALAALFVLLLAACAPASAPPATAVPAAAAPTAKPQSAQPTAKPAAVSPTAAPASKPTAKPAAPALRADYFAGKTMTFLVNYSAGGPTDIFARLVARHIKKYLPGQPNIVVQNEGGAGGILGLKQMFTVAAKDDLMVGVTAAVFAPQIFAAQEVGYDAAKFQWLGGAAEGAGAYVHKSLGARTVDEMLKTSNQIIVGGASPESGKDLSQRTFLNMLGAKYKYVTGYPGVAQMRLAMQRGEINFNEETLGGWIPSVMPLINEGTGFPMGQTGIIKGGQVVRDPRLPDLPTYGEAAVKVRGESVKQAVEYRAATALVQINSALQRSIFYGPNVEPTVVEAARKAVADTFGDKDFQAEMDKQFGYPVVFVSGAEAQSIAADIIKGKDAEPVAYLKNLAKQATQ